VDRSLEALAPQLLTTPAVVTRDIPADLPCVAGDEDALTGALIDILQNAHKYTGADKRIEVSARKLDEGIAIRVSDNGPGIPEPEQKRIFEKFYRAKDPLDRSIEGSGLGLAMVKHIVQAHGGKVFVESQPGAGATFTVVLPAVDTVPATAPARAKGSAA
jgi:two-component system phosphate regulon sensor histidine kinase PhoR